MCIPKPLSLCQAFVRENNERQYFGLQYTHLILNRPYFTYSFSSVVRTCVDIEKGEIINLSIYIPLLNFSQQLHTCKTVFGGQKI